MARKKEIGNGEDVLQTYISEIKRYSLLDFEEELELSKRIQNGDINARQRLVETNLRLVVKIARAYLKEDVAFMDIIQEGNMGLIHAAEKFDHVKNVRFSTYAAWWIRQYISRFLSNHRRTIRLPHRKEELLRKIQRTYHVLSQKFMRQPRNEEIATAIGISLEEMDFILSMTNNPLSLETETGDEEAKGIMDVQEDYTYNPEMILLREDSRKEAVRFLDQLKERERCIILHRFELAGHERHTLKKIGDKLGISPETVRQIELRALNKMRSRVEDLRNSLYAG